MDVPPVRPTATSSPTVADMPDGQVFALPDIEPVPYYRRRGNYVVRLDERTGSVRLMHRMDRAGNPVGPGSVSETAIGPRLAAMRALPMRFVPARWESENGSEEVPDG